MPIIKNRDGIDELHIAARLQMELPETENPADMTIEIFFWVRTQLNGFDIAPKYWDKKNLIIKISEEPRLLETVQLIQQIIGEKRSAQLAALPPEEIL
ncbi:MAG TPA: hypothetical protein VK211_24135 [Kamptonema sp.]|nr:hypothetical protein [Kamptonema sp.]